MLIDKIKYLICNSESLNKEYIVLIKSLAIHWIETVKNLMNYLQQHNKESILTIERFILCIQFKIYF
jgi:hypothetical protein